ncbi:MAG TPA: DUF2117 domain-containing protein [Methanomassiliicoccales archaeon]|nr:DUF2117 domain-containing protein [Methanomassiliicoccales archaeon]
MKFAVVLHGPEVVDTGLAMRVIGPLSKEGRVEAVMSGHTGVAAVIDAGLEGLVDIKRTRKPSQELARLSGSNDVLILVNYAKNRESALRFGSIVYSRCKKSVDKPLIQVDDGIIIEWNGKDMAITRRLASDLDLEILAGNEPSDEDEADEGQRRILGVIPGEHIWIDGVVVGRITSTEVKLRKGESGMLEAEGVELKQTGVDRLGDFDLVKAHVRSGSTRRTAAKARSIDTKKSGAFFIDHSAETAVHKCQNAALVVTVGDDTSKIAGSLLFRFNVPIVAITDGDEDGISSEDLKAKGSVVVRVRPGTDDIVGREVHRTIFHGKGRIQGNPTPSSMAEEVVRIAGERLVWCSVRD